MLMQNFGVTNKEHYGMLWYFLEWAITKSMTSEGNSALLPANIDDRRYNEVYLIYLASKLDWSLGKQ